MKRREINKREKTMNPKEELKRQLEEIKELTDYVSDDPEAASRLAKIRRRVEMALNAIEQTGDF